MRVPSILRSRVAPVAALYGATPGLVARWAEAPGMEAAMVAWLIGGGLFGGGRRAREAQPLLPDA